MRDRASCGTVTEGFIVREVYSPRLAFSFLRESSLAATVWEDSMSEKGGDDLSSSHSISDHPFEDAESVGGSEQSHTNKL